MGQNRGHQHLHSIKFEVDTKNSKSSDYGLIKASVPEQAGASWFVYVANTQGRGRTEEEKLLLTIKVSCSGCYPAYCAS